jgi:hypothetical protein
MVFDKKHSAISPLNGINYRVKFTIRAARRNRRDSGIETNTKKAFNRSVTVRSNFISPFVCNKSAIGGWGGRKSYKAVNKSRHFGGLPKSPEVSKLKGWLPFAVSPALATANQGPPWRVS